MNFIAGETAICSCTVRNSSGTLVNPGTSMTITISRSGVVLVDNQAMINDSVWQYHYDYDTTAKPVAVYDVLYKAVDSSRISLANTTFSVV